MESNQLFEWNRSISGGKMRTESRYAVLTGQRQAVQFEVSKKVSNGIWKAAKVEKVEKRS